jgi:hypothetical protein
VSSNEYEYGPDCLTDEQMLYVWAKNASRLDLPEGVGFHLKGGSHLVLSLHYKGASNLPKSVTPGVNVVVTKKRPAKRAGVFMMVNSFDSITPHTTGKDIKVSSTIFASPPTYNGSRTLHLRIMSRVFYHSATGAIFTPLRFLRKLGIGSKSFSVCPWQAIWYCCSLLGPFVSYEENEVL